MGVVDNLVFNTLGKQTARARISPTEQVALESGDVGIERGFFDGRPDWKGLRELPAAALSPEEKAFIDGPVSDLARRLNPHEIGDLKDLPADVWQKLKDDKIWGMIIDKDHGGLGYSATAHSAMIMKLASVSAVAAVTAMVPNSLGPGELLMRYGTDAQKDKWLPRLADGREIPAFALTSLNGGSDAGGGMMSTGTVFRDQNDGQVKIKLDISNRYITLAPIATLVGLAFRLKDPDNLLDGKNLDPDITLALVPRSTPGLEIGPRHNPMDIYFQNGTVGGKNVVIGVDDIIGGKEGVGQGWKMLMECLAVGRSISLPALATAAGKTAVQAVGSYSRVRRQFKTEIKNFQGIEEPLARIGGLTYVMDAARSTTLQMVEQHKKPTIPSAIIKYHLTEMMRQVCNDSMDVMAGAAVMNGPRNAMAELYRSAPIAITVEGANIMTRTFIIFGQGLMRAHPNLYPMLQAAKAGDKKEFGRLFTKHTLDSMRYSLASVTGLGAGAGIPQEAPKELERYYRRVNNMSARFALAASVISGIYQDKLKTQENITKRMGDVLSNLYMTMSVLNHFEQQGFQKDDIPLARWGCQYLLNRAEQAFEELFDNLHNPAVAATLKAFIQPLGVRTNPPSDRLNKEVATIVSSPCEARSRLTHGIYRPRLAEEFTRLAADGTLTEEKFVKPLSTLMLAERLSIGTEKLEAQLSQALKDESKAIYKGEPARHPALRALLETKSESNRESLLRAAFADGVLKGEDYPLMQESDRIRTEALSVDTFTPDMRPL